MRQIIFEELRRSLLEALAHARGEIALPTTVLPSSSNGQDGSVLTNKSQFDSE